MMTGRQLRMAAAGLGLTFDEVAAKAGIGVRTIRRMTAVDTEPPGRATTVNKIQRALEAAGAVFASDEEGEAVKIVRPKRRRKR